jgi:hypothetical protein
MTAAYDLIVEHYAMQCAKRSRVPLINHINEGLIVLDAICATNRAKDAFCIHPMLQHDRDLNANWKEVADACDSETIMLAMEYRSVANEFLSDKLDNEYLKNLMYDNRVEEAARAVRLSPLKEVNQMLVADKVQNYKDFVTYHQKTHAHSSELDDYFNIWFEALGITDKAYVDFCKLIDESKK